jgi:hypothetical protein
VEPTVIEAETAKARGQVDHSVDVLSDVISESNNESPEAIVRLVDTLVEQGRPVPADLALLAEAFSFELQGSDIGDEMYRAFVLSAGSSGQFDKAFNSIGKETASMGDRMKSSLVRELFSMLSKTAEDIDFIQNFFTYYRKFEYNLDEDSKLLVADRLIDLGFMDEAQELENSLTENFISDDRKVLRAKLFNYNGSFSESLEIIENLDTKEAAALKAAALEEIGKNAEAADMYTKAELPERVTSNLWLDENWISQIDPGTPIFGSLVDIVSQVTDLIEPDDEMIKNSEVAVANSISTRSAIRNTLDMLRLSE